MGGKCRIHCGWFDYCLRLDIMGWCCFSFNQDSVPSSRGAIRGTNSIGPVIVFLYHFSINQGFAGIAGW